MGLSDHLRELGRKLGVRIGGTTLQHTGAAARGEFFFQFTHAGSQLQHRFFFGAFGSGFRGQHFHLFTVPHPLEHAGLHGAHVENHGIDAQFVAHFFQCILRRIGDEFDNIHSTSGRSATLY